jgi:hypothetical protein
MMRVSTLTGTALRPIAMLTAHSTPLMGMTLKKRPTGVCMMMTCRQQQHQHQQQHSQALQCAADIHA